MEVWVVLYKIVREQESGYIFDSIWDSEEEAIKQVEKINHSEPDIWRATYTKYVVKEKRV